MIEHEGIIEKINGNHITVRILQQSACSACHAKGACMAADAKEKLVDVSDHTGKFRENERVIVTGTESTGHKAVLWAFVFPFVLLIAMLVLGTSVWHFTETEAAMGSLLILIPYYFLLYLLRHKMANTFRFNIKKTN
ncbi:SoxR reducing system RseC family protein [Proteiniphilum sp. UBA1028]|jgi:sigma-E factor negative regulatory protein RseC|uniref:SoxR reducing system RseC family protein n=1 Tax=Proteiniphilum sp. UBA1028 TaxID=1947251 RepID=UPI000E9FC76C|nr:SoxR reducing system RseC family protein [Proteiniphilum sp. UBA1028]HBG57877.1 Fis family transcriptional regulator [Porphyromonadaceae bacterium]